MTMSHENDFCNAVFVHFFLLETEFVLLCFNLPFSL